MRWTAHYRRTGTIALHPVPHHEPPYDGDGGDTEQLNSGRGGIRPPVQGALALAFDLDTGVPAEPQSPPDLRLVPRPNDDAPDRGGLLDPQPWCARLVQAIVEVLAGERPAGQLIRWTSPAVFADLRRAAPATAGSRVVRQQQIPHRRTVVRSVHVSEPTPGVAEVCALVWNGQRARAIALRLQGRHGRWQCTSLLIG